MKYVSSPDERFKSIAGCQFTINYSMVDDGGGRGLLIYYLDEGGARVKPILFFSVSLDLCIFVFSSQTLVIKLGLI
jgi:hypothetical protein